MSRDLDNFCGETFWNSSLTWYTETPDLTRCFEKSVLVWIPCWFLWIFTPLEIYYMKKSKHRYIPWNWLNIAKVLTTIVLIVCTCVDLGMAVDFYNKGSKNSFYIDILGCILKFVTYVLSILLMIFNKKYGIRTSGVLVLFWLFIFINSGTQVYTESMGIQPREDNYYLISSIIYSTLSLVLLILSTIVDDVPNHGKKQKPTPYDGSGFLRRIFYFYYDSFAWKGFKTPITQADLWPMNDEDTARSVLPSFTKYWNENLARRKNKRISVLLPLVKTFKATYIFAAFLRLLQDLLVFVMPTILRLLIQFIEKSEPTWKGYFYASVMFVAANVQTWLLAHYYHKVYVVGMRVRTVLMSLIFQKSLKLSATARREKTVGQTVNLMSVDVEKLVEISANLNLLWSLPLQAGLALYFLWDILGPSVLAGLTVLIIMIPLNGFIVSRVKFLQVKQMKYKDQRVKIMNEILSGIKVLKLYAWEVSFQDQVMEIREKEIKILKKEAYLNALTTFIWSTAPFLVSLVTFATFILIGDNVLDASTAFVSLTLFNILRQPLSSLPKHISSTIQAAVSLRRINDFMSSEDLSDNNISHDEDKEYALSIENGSFSWGDITILDNINLKLRNKSLTAIVGTVGSGKSSLISACLGEMITKSGKVNTTGNIAYVPQTAWIQNATLQDNILFGSKYNKQTYDEIIEACALLPDIQILPAGDQTEIGEKGINLSGGQKQRVSLARALYSNADLYFLDDPLSAVDSHVGKHIFEKVVGPNGLLKNKTRVLATHNITFLSQCDNIVVLNDGRITEFGNCEELLEKQGVFSEFLLQYSHNKKDYDGFIESDLENDQNLLKNNNKLGEGDRNIDSKKLIKEEKVETGNVKLGVYKQYLKFVGYKMIIFTLALSAVCQAFGAGSNFWLSIWSTDKEIVVNGTTNYEKQYLYLGVYGGLGIVEAVSVFIQVMVLFIGALNGAKLLHNTLLSSTLKAPITTFFDVTPIGRILNRFSKDVDTLDNVLPIFLQLWIMHTFKTFTILIVISSTTPIFVAVAIPVIIFFYFIQRFFIAASRQLKRLESISRSPIYSHFSETVAGAHVIRAFSQTSRFTKESEEKVDSFQNAYWVTLVANRWIAIRLEMLANTIVLFSALFVVINKEQNAGLAGLSLSYALEIIPMLNALVRITSDVEANIVAVERIEEYRITPPEAPWDLPNRNIDNQWPQKGMISFQDYSLRYRPGLDLVLKNLSCRIEAGEKIGIVGRTGAGKSTLTLALFRIIESDNGQISIDNTDIAGIGLHSLRSRLTIIPQEAILFSGTLRVNIDPFGRYTDEEIWAALGHAHLKNFVKSLPSGLSHEVLENGENFSVGQRQLICLCRALLRKSKILVLDEATAAVDMETDDLIQKTIRTQFKECTVLTIAHRLNTIMDSDKILVLDKGFIAEYDTPAKLLADKQSLFHSLCKDAGIS